MWKNIVVSGLVMTSLLLLPLMAADMELSGVIVRSSSFSRVSLLSAAASILLSAWARSTAHWFSA